MESFQGTKAAFILDDTLLTYLRDDRHDLEYANMWDFPGGGCEGDETPRECLARELHEEFGLTLNEQNILWKRTYPSKKDRTKVVYFYVVKITRADIEAISFGTEGQRWTLMPVNEFFTRRDVVPFLKERFAEYVKACA